MRRNFRKDLGLSSSDRLKGSFFFPQVRGTYSHREVNRNWGSCASDLSKGSFRDRLFRSVLIVCDDVSEMVLVLIYGMAPQV